MTNKKTGSSFRLNPCDFAVYDQDGDLEVTMKDFDIIFADSEQHSLVEQLFHALDKDSGNIDKLLFITHLICYRKNHLDIDVFSSKIGTCYNSVHFNKIVQQFLFRKLKR